MSSKPKPISRREFISRSSQAAAGIVAGSVLVSSTFAAPVVSNRVIGANDRLLVAHIGIRSQGRSLMRGFAGIEHVEVKTLCDVDLNLIPERAAEAAEIQGTTPGAEQDMRRVFEDKDITAVVIATPNHWHALATIWACQAGKHVFVEKPTSHNIWEGRKMVEAARRYDRIVQSGFMNRSRDAVRQAMQFLHDGRLGDIYMARGLCFKPRNSLGSYPDGPLAPGEEYAFTVGSDRKEPPYTPSYLAKVDYDLWLGPAPKKPFNRNRFHYNWHWHWDYGNGDTGNQGPHQFDIARWGLNKHDHPVKIRSFGGYFAFDSSQETPNTQTSIFEYADGTILEFGTRGLYTNAEGQVRIGNLFYGTEGWMSIDGNGQDWQTYFGRKNEPGPGSADQPDAEGGDPLVLTSIAGGHYQNFTDAIRSGRREDLTSEIEEGHRSTVLPHLGNISYLLGRELTFDGKKEKFSGDREANKLLTRKYRKPYVVPKTV
ncbi:MAG: Gfo/Idh/MocA family oxidoreductase [Candidatus Marinimicrobia bacterium]|nr:Gfo/Idh/MocA family oxidoreductase [Candidatus Neomarinimicrobiota bacterium]